MQLNVKTMAMLADKLIDTLIKAARTNGYQASEGYGSAIGIAAHEEAQARMQLEMFLAHVLRKLDKITEVLED